MKELLIEQNRHWFGERGSYYHRDQLLKLISYLPLRQIITISGIRRCGKSSLAKQAIRHLIDTGVEAKNILFLNLEHPYFIEHRTNVAFLGNVYDEYLKLMDPKGKVYFFLDEIQFFENWQVYIKSKYENSDIKFIITGSNSSLLSNDLNTLLSGRSLNVHLEPFSFTEFLRVKEIGYETEVERLNHRIDIRRALDEYLVWGGFCEVFLVENEMIKKEILLAYAKNIIYQDIVPRYQIRNSAVLERLFFYLLSNATKALNYTTLATIFELSDKTIKEYINYFEETFLLKRLDKYHFKPKEKIKSQKKLYVLDNGFLQIAPKHSKNLGQAMENFVFIQLNRNCADLTYLKEVQEVDFYDGNKLLQVTYKMEDETTRKREISSLQSFKTSFDKPLVIVTYDHNETMDEIEMISLERWLFEKEDTILSS